MPLRCQVRTVTTQIQALHSPQLPGQRVSALWYRYGWGVGGRDGHAPTHVLRQPGASKAAAAFTNTCAKTPRQRVRTSNPAGCGSTVSSVHGHPASSQNMKHQLKLLHRSKIPYRHTLYGQDVPQTLAVQVTSRLRVRYTVKEWLANEQKGHSLSVHWGGYEAAVSTIAMHEVDTSTSAVVPYVCSQAIRRTLLSSPRVP